MINIIQENNQKMAEIVSDDIVLSTVEDALDLMADADTQGARCIAIYKRSIDPSFFDLKTGLAGEVLQKYANYRMKLCIIGEFERYKSKSLHAFIAECNRGSSVFFVTDIEAAIGKMTG